MAKVKKPFYKRWWFILIVIIVLIGMTNLVKREIRNASDKKAVYVWPDSTLVSMLSQPDSKNGRVVMENENYFSIDVYKVSKEYFEEYVKECKDSGFTEDYVKYDNSYSANNKDGYSLNLNYDEKEKILRISLSSGISDESSSLKTKNESNSSVGQIENEDTGKTEEITESEKSSKIADSESNTELETETKLQADSELNSSSTETSEGIRSEFKEILDGYEAFMNEYCEFMKKYAESDDVLSMAADYAQIMQKEIEWIDKIESLEKMEMNDAEARYYAEVNLRVSQKLLEVTS